MSFGTGEGCGNTGLAGAVAKAEPRSAVPPREERPRPRRSGSIKRLKGLLGTGWARLSARTGTVGGARGNTDLEGHIMRRKVLFVGAAAALALAAGGGTALAANGAGGARDFARSLSATFDWGFCVRGRGGFEDGANHDAGDDHGGNSGRH